MLPPVVRDTTTATNGRLAKCFSDIIRNCCPAGGRSTRCGPANRSLTNAITHAHTGPFPNDAARIHFSFFVYCTIPLFAFIPVAFKKLLSCCVSRFATVFFSCFERLFRLTNILGSCPADERYGGVAGKSGS